MIKITINILLHSLSLKESTNMYVQKYPHSNLYEQWKESISIPIWAVLYEEKKGRPHKISKFIQVTQAVNQALKPLTVPTCIKLNVKSTKTYDTGLLSLKIQFIKRTASYKTSYHE